MKLTRSPAGAALAVDRHEEKFLLNPAEAVCLRALLDGLLRRDRYSAGGAYYIRSLYFDTPDNTDYADKVLGVFLAEPVADVLASATTGALFFWRFPKILEHRRQELAQINPQ